MNLLALLQDRFRAALTAQGHDPAGLVEMVRPSQDAKFGDYQANLAMPLGKRLGRSPRDVAAEIVSRLELDDICEPPEIAGPGFINLRVKTPWLADRLEKIWRDSEVDNGRLGIEPTPSPRTYVIDYSAPNVAKPMHVGHIRSTVIGAALYRTLQFLGHKVVSDNHIGDWGTQFGMIIFGYKHFLDRAAYERNPVEELSRLYRLVNRLVDYHEAVAQLPKLRERTAEINARWAREHEASTQKPGATDKQVQKSLRKLENDLEEATAAEGALEAKIAAAQADVELGSLVRKFTEIGQAVLAETVKLHRGDAENLRLWEQFVPACRTDIERIYDRLKVRFDVALGESFYHDRLAGVVEELITRGIARESEGAICVFLEESPAPLIVRKRDGAYLYGTTDLATIQYRMAEWKPDAILYVVDHRQSLHFEQLFATARRWGYGDVELKHVSFGTVLGEDNRPFKTREGDTVGLEGLLDEAVRRAYDVVSSSDAGKPDGPQMSEERRREVAEAVGIGALKYADLSQNRTSDYVFSYEKMLAMNGNTATYMQYAYARVTSIFAKGNVNPADLKQQLQRIDIEHPAERALALTLVQFHEALAEVAADYRPNFLTTYLFDLANRYSTFFEQCPVLRADTPEQRASRLVLCDVTARTIKQGLELLGIDVVERM